MPAERPAPDCTPTDIKLKRAEQKLIVRWADGTSTEYDAPTLRQNCPCAVLAVATCGKREVEDPPRLEPTLHVPHRLLCLAPESMVNDVDTCHNVEQVFVEHVVSEATDHCPNIEVLFRGPLLQV